jgi:hypothetical protein
MGSTANNSNALTWELDVSAPSTKMTLDSSGNLGLGVTPSAWNSAYKALDIGNSLGIIGSGSSADLYFNAFINSSSNFIYKQTATASAYSLANGQHRWYNAPSGTAGNAISFTQAMTLDASGNLGIGTTTIAYRLDVRTSGTNDIGFFATSAGGGSRILFSDGNTGTQASAPRIGANANDLLFYTNTSGNNSTERARITSGGALLVGTTGTDPIAGRYNGFVVGSGGSIDLRHTANTSDWGISATSGTIVNFYSDNGSASVFAGNISVNGAATAYNTSSDYRLKDNPQPLTGSGAFIDALKPKTWNWKADGSRGVGFIAHEVQEVSPNSVVGAKDAVDAEGKPVYQAMEYGSAEFIANIIAELQSLRARVAQLEAK